MYSANGKIQEFFPALFYLLDAAALLYREYIPIKPSYAADSRRMHAI